jgi:hypothetical protein
MGGVMKKAKAKKAKAKKTTAKKAKKAGPSSPARTAAKASPSGALGCCTITYDDKKDEQVAGVTKARCTTLARARGGVGQWNKGACA